MLWTFLQSFIFIPLMASEEMIFEYFFSNLAFRLHGNQSNSVVWTKFIWLVEDYSRNISVKLLSKYLHSDNNMHNFQVSVYYIPYRIACWQSF